MASMKMPTFQLYPKDLLADTAWLSNEEFGVYVRLLLYAWIGLPGYAQGELPTSGDLLLPLVRLSEQEWEKMFARLAPFFSQEGNGKMSQKRLLAELQKRSSAIKEKQNRAPQCDNEFLTELQSSPAYAGIDVKREHAKALLWCKNRRRQATRKFFLGWLNRIDQPMESIKEIRKAVIPG